MEEVITNHKNKLIDSCKLSTLYDQYYLFVKQKYEVTFSMLEIYNEQVRDLLTKDNPKGGLQVLITGHNCYLRVTREGSRVMSVHVAMSLQALVQPDSMIMQ